MSNSTLLVLFAGLSAYLMPSIIAFTRNHRQWFLIAVFNVFLGWTGFVWIACGIWACSGDARPLPPRQRSVLERWEGKQ